MTDARILYIHGAGNRAPDAEGNATLLRARLGLEGTPDRLAVSDWGERLGTDAALPRIDLVMPTYAQPGHVAGAVGRQLPDALAPLRAMAGTPAGAGVAAPRAGIVAAPASDADRLLAFLALGAVDLSAYGIAPGQLAAAAREIAATPEYAAAHGDAIDLLDATATSVLARAVERDPSGPRRAGIAGLDLGWLAGRVADVAGELLGTGIAGAVASWLAPELSPALALWASRTLAPRRTTLMHDHLLVIADVLRYQRHGEEIRQYVRQEIATLASPRLVIAHSLGGIIAVDALFGPGATDLDVALLVTFGSQSAMLSAIDALDDITPTVPWLNLWATYDFVSFLDAGLWPGKVDDRELRLDIGFPAAHGSYYASDELGRAIRSHPAAAGVFD